VNGLSLFRQTLFWTFNGGLIRRRRQIMEQMYEIGIRSILFITVTIGVLGMITVLQAVIQIQKILPEYSMVGPAFIQAMVREFGPTIGGLMIATRVGSGIAAEIGSMVVTEQVDALRMSNADPVDYLVVPRFVSCTVMTVVLSIYGATIGVLAGGVVGVYVWGIAGDTFFRLVVVSTGDTISGLLKAVTYGMAIPIVCAQAGLSTRGGAEGVGEATTKAVVNSSFAVIALDLVISAFSYMFLFCK